MTTITRESVLQDYTAKLEAVEGLVVEVENKEQALAELLAGGIATVEALEAELKEATASLATMTDMTKARAQQAIVEGLQKDVQLQKGINEQLASNFVGGLDADFEALYTAHNEAKNSYRTLDNEYMATMSIRTAEADKELLQGLANRLNNAYANTNAILRGFGLADQGAKMWHGFHLGQATVVTKGYSLANDLNRVAYNNSIQ